MHDDPEFVTFLRRVWIVLALGLGIAACMLIAFVSIARAHSFYDWECCHERDCWPTGGGEREPDPIKTPAGWMLADGTIIPYGNVRQSPDGRFHVCRRNGEPDGPVIRPEKRPVCLYVPPEGF